MCNQHGLCWGIVKLPATRLEVGPPTQPTLLFSLAQWRDDIVSDVRRK